MRRYFETAAIRRIALPDVAVYDRDEIDEGAVAGLQDNAGLTLGLGVVRSMEKETLQVLTPISDLAPLTSLRVGRLKLDPMTGEERFLRP